MSKVQNKKKPKSRLLTILNQTMVYIHRNMSESVIINYIDEDNESFNATGQSSDEKLQIGFFEVDLKEDHFFRLLAIDVNKI